MLNKLKSWIHRVAPPPIVEAERIVEPKPMGVTVRAVGICKTEGCKSYNDPKFLFSMHLDPIHVCTECHRAGMVVKEEFSIKQPDNLTFFQVRVEYNFRPSLVADVHEGTWHGLCIVSDESMSKDENVYTLRSPLIQTEKRAAAVATSILGGLLQDPEEMLKSNPGSRPKENLIDFDEPLGGVKAQLWELEEKLRGSRLTQEYKG